MAQQDRSTGKLITRLGNTLKRLRLSSTLTSTSSSKSSAPELIQRTVNSKLCELCLGFEEKFLRPYNFFPTGFERKPGGLSYPHHRSWQVLKLSADAGCELCSLFRIGFLETIHARRQSKGGPDSCSGATIDDTDLYLNALLDGSDDREYFTIEIYSASTAVTQIFRHSGNFADTSAITFRCNGTRDIFYNDVFFVIGARADSPAMIEGKILGRICPVSPDFNTAKQWFEDCNRGHLCCQNNLTSLPPSRLIHVDKDGVRVKLIETDMSQKYKYVTLSHRWGTSKHFSTQKDNYNDRLIDIPIENLPATFLDAVIVTNRSGFQYLWIDSLCIIQDDTADWNNECMKMSSIYSGSVLTIAAPAAKDSEAGFLQNRKFIARSDLKPCLLQYRDSAGNSVDEVIVWFPGYPKQDTGISKNNVLAEQPNSVLEGRGWILQEKLLSNRTLLFGEHQMYYECMHSTRYEIFVDFCRFHTNTRRLTKLIPVFSNSLEYYLWWQKFVCEYSGTALSNPTDRLPAISGIAKAYKRPGEDFYLAGLWEGDLPTGLLWHRENYNHNDFEVEAPSQVPYTAPSWSWAGHDFAISYQHSEACFWFLEILDASVQLSGADIFGRVKHGILRVRGKIRQARVGCYMKGACKSYFLYLMNPSPFRTTNKLLDLEELVQFYPDDSNPYRNLPIIDAGEKVHREDFPFFPTAKFPEISVLLLGQFKHEARMWIALAIDQVSGTNKYQRIGLVKGFTPLSDPESESEFGPLLDWYGGVRNQELEII